MSNLDLLAGAGGFGGGSGLTGVTGGEGENGEGSFHANAAEIREELEEARERLNNETEGENNTENNTESEKESGEEKLSEGQKEVLDEKLKETKAGENKKDESKKNSPAQQENKQKDLNSGDEKKSNPPSSGTQTETELSKENNNENNSQQTSPSPAPLPSQPSQPGEIPDREELEDRYIPQEVYPADPIAEYEIGTTTVTLEDYAESTFEDQETIETFVKLGEYGLNLTKPEIIGIHEFIPVVETGNNEDSASLNVTSLFDNNYIENNGGIKINGCGRLIELHRQIRSYITDSAKTVLGIIRGDTYNKSVIEKISNNITLTKLEANDLIMPTMKETVEKVINFFIEGGVDEEIKSLAIDKKTDVYFRGIIEYYIYLLMFPYISKYIGKLAYLGLNLDENWGIDKFNKIKPFTTSALRDPELREVFENNPDLLSGEDIEDARSGDPSLIQTLFSNITSLTRLRRQIGNSRPARDIDAFYNVIYNIYSLINHVDSITFLEGESKTAFSAGNISYGVVGDLGGVIQRMKGINEVTSYASVRNRLSNRFRENFKESLLDDGRGPIALQINNDNVVGLLEKESRGSVIKENFNENSVSYYAYMRECFSASVFDSVSKIAKQKISGPGNDIGTLFNYSEGNANLLSEDQSPSEIYFRDVLGINIGLKINKFKKSNYPTPRAGRQLDVSNPLISGGFGETKGTIFEPFFYGQKIEIVSGREDTFGGQTTTEVHYVPLESKGFPPGSVVSGTKNGPDYFINPSIPRSADDFESFALNYQNFTNNLIEDIMTLIPDEEVAKVKQVSDTLPRKLLSAGSITPLSFMSEVFRRLADDLERLIEVSSQNERTRAGHLRKLLFLFLESDSAVEKNLLLNSSYLGTYNALEDRLGPNAREFKTENNNNIQNAVKEVNDNLVDRCMNNLVGSDPRRARPNNNYRDEDFASISKKISDPTGITLADRNVLPGSNFTTTINQFDADGNTVSIPNFDIPTFTIPRKECIKAFNNALGPRDYQNNTFLRSIDKRAIQYATGVQRLFPFSMFFFCNGAPSDLGHNEILNEPNGIINFSMAANHYLFHTFVRILLKNTITMYAKSPGVANNEYLSLGMEGIYGLVRGIRDAVEEANNPGRISTSQISALPTEIHAYDEGKRIVESFLQTVKKRNEKIRDNLGLLAGHSEALSSIVEAVRALNTSSNEDLLRLIINVLQSQGPFGGNLFEDIIEYKNDLYPAQSMINYFDYFNTQNYDLIPNSEKHRLAKVKYMSKVLSLNGYGFLNNENLGLKSILNVGITNSLIKELKKRATSSSNLNYADSKYVTVNIYKKDHLNEELLLFPKVFVFNTDYHIHDYGIVVNKQSGLSNHLLNVDSIKDLDDLIKMTEYTTYTVNSQNGLTVSANTNFSGNSELFINHILDYVLKFYIKITTGLDFHESSFPLKRSGMKFNRIVDNLTDGNLIISDFNKIVERLSIAYPSVFQNNELQAEADRMTKFLKNMFPFSNTKRFEKSVRPGMFDRTYSVFINEKDFVPVNSYGNISDINFLALFNPEFTINSKISRPLDYIYNGENELLKKYQLSNRTGNPAIFSYYAQIGILPSDFL